MSAEGSKVEPVVETTEGSTTSNLRINIMAAGAFVVILCGMAVVVWFTQIGEYAQGIITLVIGRFLGYTDAIYNYEFSTTRANKVKDATIASQAQALSPTNGKH